MPEGFRSPPAADQSDPPPLDRSSGPARFWQAASGYWRGPGSATAWGITLVLILSICAQILIQYRLNLWSHDFFDALERRDGRMLRIEAQHFVLFAGLSVSVAITTVWSRMTLQREWRAWLTRQLIARWFTGAAVARLQFGPGEDANPEYRLAEDVRIATDAPVALVAGLLSASLGAVTFIGILWNVGGDLSVRLDASLLTVPKYLVIAVGLYALLLTLTMALIARGMIRVIASKNAAEAQFRAVGAHLQLTSAQPVERQDAGQLQGRMTAAFAAVILDWRLLCYQWMRTTMISQGNVLVAPIVGWLLCAPKYLTGTMTLGQVAQAVSAFVLVQAALNWLVDNYPGLADCLSSVNRVAALLRALDRIS